MKHQFLMGIAYCLLCGLILAGMKLVASQRIDVFDHTNEPQYKCTPECRP